MLGDKHENLSELAQFSEVFVNASAPGLDALPALAACPIETCGFSSTTATSPAKLLSAA